IGILTYDSGPEGYAGNLNHRCVTIPQVLKANGYRTYMSGKWHVASSLTKPTDTWPLQRGFDAFYGTIIGAGSFYDPNTLTRGNDNIVASGILKAHWKLTERDPTQPPWTEAEQDEQFRAWTLRCMEVYAAQIDRMDQGIGRILAALERNGQLDDTLVIFLADNGACAEDIPEDVTIDELVDKLMIARRTTRSGEPVHFGNDTSVMPGPENTYQSYGTAWANLSNSPFRL